jgi:hypothetical protein
MPALADESDGVILHGYISTKATEVNLQLSRPIICRENHRAYTLILDEVTPAFLAHRCRDRRPCLHEIIAPAVERVSNACCFAARRAPEGIGRSGGIPIPRCWVATMEIPPRFGDQSRAMRFCGKGIGHRCPTASCRCLAGFRCECWRCCSATRTFGNPLQYLVERKDVLDPAEGSNL